MVILIGPHNSPHINEQKDDIGELIASDERRSEDILLLTGQALKLSAHLHDPRYSHSANGDSVGSGRTRSDRPDCRMWMRWKRKRPGLRESSATRLA
jgi:hypothetical protein